MVWLLAVLVPEREPERVQALVPALVLERVQALVLERVQALVQALVLVLDCYMLRVILIILA